MSGISTSEEILVLGIGNILLGDEGVGVRAVEALTLSADLPAGVCLLDGGTAGYTLIDLIPRYGKVIIVDAVRGGESPGTLYRLTANDILERRDLKLSGHQIDLAEVLALARRLSPLPEIVLIGVEPASLEYCLELSPVLQGGMDRLLSAIRREVETAAAAS